MLVMAELMSAARPASCVLSVQTTTCTVPSGSASCVCRRRGGGGSVSKGSFRKMQQGRESTRCGKRRSGRSPKVDNENCVLVSKTREHKFCCARTYLEAEQSVIVEMQRGGGVENVRGAAVGPSIDGHAGVQPMVHRVPLLALTPVLCCKSRVWVGDGGRRCQRAP